MQLKIYKIPISAMFTRGVDKPPQRISQLFLLFLLFLILTPTVHFGQASALMNNTLTPMTTNHLPGVVPTSSQIPILGGDEFTLKANMTDASLTNASNYSALALGSA